LNVLVFCFVFGVPLTGLAQGGASQEFAPSSDKVRMLLLDLKATLIEKEVATIVTNMVSSELAREKSFALITNTDVKQMMALEAEKQTMGCDNESSCLAEIAGAMGARFVVYGDVGKLGSNIIITLNVFDSVQAESAGRVTETVNNLDALPQTVPTLVTQLVAAFKTEGTPKVQAASLPVVQEVSQEQKVAKAPATPAPQSHIDAVEGTGFPWLRVGLSLGLATVGGVAASAYGWPAYDTMISAQKAYEPVKGQDTQEAAGLYEAASVAQTTYMGAPAVAMFGGGLLALVGASYALYVTGDALSQEE
jgi:hypothetical protein